MHLPNCHPPHRAFALTSSATLAPFLGGAQFNGFIREEKLYNRGFTLKSTNLQTALLPLLTWLLPFSSPRSCQKSPFCCYLGWRRSARTQRSCSGNKYERVWHNCGDVQSDQRNVECDFHLPGRSDQHSHRSRATISMHLLPAVVYGQENPKLRDEPGADATALCGPKKIGGVLHIPAGGDDFTFQRQAAVSSSSLGRPCKGSYHTAAKLSQPDLHVLLVSSNRHMSWRRWWKPIDQRFVLFRLPWWSNDLLMENVAVNFEIHRYASGVTMENASFRVCTGRWSQQLTSYPKRCSPFQYKLKIMARLRVLIWKPFRCHSEGRVRLSLEACGTSCTRASCQRHFVSTGEKWK